MQTPRGIARIPDLGSFDQIIDTRSPAEFAEDHIPGAINCPVLDNAQRAQVGTIYKQVSAFEARKLGAAMVAENIARHLMTHFQDQPKDWRPLLYCWRGGQRSGSFTTWMRMIGWDACQLEGGYKTYRRHVIDQIAALPPTLRFVVVCGATGSGKTRLLDALAAAGAQVLDLEGLARHKGSVLGRLPGIAQPPQKSFETALHEKLAGYSPERPVFVEAESRKIGSIQIPEALIERIRQSECVAIEASRAARLDFLLNDYAYLGHDVADFKERIDCLRGFQSNSVLDEWKRLAEVGDLATLFAAFIDEHYDPLYQRSQNRNFVRFGEARPIVLETLSADQLAAAAADLIQSLT
ncbi:tRNA 2-selenouridine(34) synthase MnmH [Niveibacterium sp. 24ML]|uniref:tRNA 2-selenouridine(34) synthase MnmH n=1 Tax=Niveibacterium sp. 24ML TaxID=2985512 RepID=UPI00226FFD58|nr:tRNA 2-selenouridine(34) synthase MnmH [Niveibacterium sp. 24ML]MCX9156588.1 tRNA 2-selenouridine(34) synthase MnmH [Niveibacterium sp. 24ML]